MTDEIYDRILYDGREHIPLATLPEMAGRTITVGGLSKTFSITGWRLGFFVAQEPWATGTRTIHDFTTICAPTPLQAAGVVAYSLGEDFYARQLEDYHERRDLMMEIHYIELDSGHKWVVAGEAFNGPKWVFGQLNGRLRISVIEKPEGFVLDLTIPKPGSRKKEVYTASKSNVEELSRASKDMFTMLHDHGASADAVS